MSSDRKHHLPTRDRDAAIRKGPWRLHAYSITNQDPDEGLVVAMETRSLFKPEVRYRLDQNAVAKLAKLNVVAAQIDSRDVYVQNSLDERSLESLREMTMGRFFWQLVHYQLG